MSSRTDVYAYPQLDRAGLANLLFTWARCEVFAHQHGLPRLRPRWTQFKIGPFLRGERDKRYYIGLFNNSDCIGGLRKWWLLKTAQHVEEDQARQFMQEANAGQHPGKHIVVFKSMGRFGPLHAHRQLVRQRLYAMLAPDIKRILEQSPREYPVVVHIRYGDKNQMTFGREWDGGSGRTLPVQWYANAVKALHSAISPDVQVTVFTDAFPDQIKPLLEIPNVHLAPPNPSIVDILLLARGKVLITSGTSSFSWWAAWLGEMPSLWFPGMYEEVYPHLPHYHHDTDLYGHPPEAFLKLAREKLAHP